MTKKGFFFGSSSKRTGPSSEIEYDSGRQQQEQSKNVDDDVVVANDHNPKIDDRFCTKCRCISISFILIIAIGVALSLILTGDANPLNYWIPVDPPGASAANRWDATSGLTLTVENAVDDTWRPIVEQTLMEWDTTDALSLNVQQVPRDIDCEPTNGRLKICNSDYGETPWHGINIKLVDHLTNLTVHSVAKLNDRYNERYEEKLYIACHEVGHGLGLPHTDEDHFNRDRGDCMDYTIRPENNMNPGQFNLDLLVELYGTPTQPLGSSIDSSSSGTTVGSGFGSGTGSQGNQANNDDSRPRPRPPQQEDEEKKEEEEDEDDRRKLNRSLFLRGSTQQSQQQQSQQQRRRQLQITATTTTLDMEDIMEAERFAQDNCYDHECWFDVPNYGSHGATIIVSALLRRP